MSIMSLRGFILDVSCGNGDSSLPFFWRFIDLLIICKGGTACLGENFRDSSGEGGLKNGELMAAWI